MRLRFPEDARTLLWAFLLFPLAPTLAYGNPERLPWILPLLIYSSYCAGVIAHNHNHCPVFSGRKANLFFASWISFFYGMPIFTWVPTHNHNHHRYVDGPGDVTSTRRHSSKSTPWVALTYPITSTREQLQCIAPYVLSAFRQRPARLRRMLAEALAVVGGHGALFALAIHLHGPKLGTATYAAAIFIPSLLASYWMMLTNFVQHIECDPSSADNHSRNFTSPLWNWFVFNGGYHTVHHENPGTHWSRYPALHASRSARIEPRLNLSSPLTYLFGSRVDRLETRERQ